jgi:hypothetical protein
MAMLELVDRLRPEVWSGLVLSAIWVAWSARR